MPIELRPSDVSEARAQAYQKMGQNFGNTGILQILGPVLGRALEQERVREVNSGLVTLEEFWQKQYEEFPQKGFEILPETVPGRNLANPQAIAPTIKTLGEVQYSDVLKEHHKAVDALADNIRATVRNKKAQEELLQHLTAGAIQQQGRLLGAWKTAAKAHEIATLDDLAKTEMRNVATLGWEEPTRRIGVQVATMLGAGMIDEAKAQEYMSQVTEQAQYIQGYNGVFGAMEEAEKIADGAGLDAGRKWLEKNTPFWAGNPGAREKVLADSWRALESFLNDQAKTQDTRFSEIYVQADTPEKIDAAMGELRANTLMRGTQKKQWMDWLQEKRARVLKAEAGLTADVVSALYTRMYDAKDNNRNPGLEVTTKEIDEVAKDKSDHQALLAKRDELQRSYESGLGSTKEEVLLAGYDIVYHPNMSVAAKQKWIDDHVRAGGGLSAEDGTKLRNWIDSYNGNPDRKNAMDAITTAYHLSMAKPDMGPTAKKELALELYNARNAMEALFINPKTTKADIAAAVEDFLSKRATLDLQALIKQTYGAPITSYATGELRGGYREATAYEYLREQGKLTAETAAQFPQDIRPKAEQLEKDALKKAAIKTEFTARLSSGDLIYSTKPIAKGPTGKLLMSDTGEQGTLYQVRYQVKNGTYVPTVYKQNPQTGVFDVIAWEWK